MVEVIGSVPINRMGADKIILEFTEFRETAIKNKAERLKQGLLETLIKIKLTPNITAIRLRRTTDK